MGGKAPRGRKALFWDGPHEAAVRTSFLPPRAAAGPWRRAVSGCSHGIRRRNPYLAASHGRINVRASVRRKPQNVESARP